MNTALRVWLVDDDASIRWVLERALRNDGMAPRAFEAAEPALACAATRVPGCPHHRHPYAGRLGARAPAPHPRCTPGAAGDRHDRALGPGQCRLRLRGWGVRVLTQALRHRQGGGARAACGQRRRAGQRRCRRHPAHPGAARARTGDAAGVPRHRPARALERDGAHYRGVGHGQGAGGARPARAQPARRQALRRAQHRGDPGGSSGVGALRPRARRVHRRGHAAPRPLRAGRRRHAVPG